MKYVQYQVQGAGIHQAGPYEDHEAEDQLRDIAGYEGVFNAHLIAASDSADPATHDSIGFIPTSIGD
jgi:hypothetical protein